MNRTNRILTLTLTVLLLFFSGQASAQNALLDELMDKSGITKQLEGFSELLQMGFSDATQGAEPEKQEELKLIQEKMARAYDMDKFNAALRKSMGENLNDADITEVLKWLNSPLGQKITRIEEKGSTVEAEQAKQAFMMSFDPQSISQERLAAVGDLESAINATELLLTIILNSQKAIMMAVMPYVPVEQRISAKEIDMQIEMNRPILQSQYEDYIIGSMVFTYQELSDDELKSYVAFAQTPAGIKYHKVTSNAFSEAFTQAAAAFGDEIGSSIPAEKVMQ